MTDDDITGLDLPRRKLLGALGVVGASSAGAGLGTSAFFNDTESFRENSLTAGELNLKLSGSVDGTNSPAIDIVTKSSGGTIDGTTPTAFFGLSDIKPGDLAIVCLEIIIDGNPAHLKINGSVVSDDNSINEAEKASGETDPLGSVSTSGTGELASKTDVQAFGPIPSSGFAQVGVGNYQTLDSFSASGGDNTFAAGGNVPMNVSFPGSGTGYVLLSDRGTPKCFDPDRYRVYFALGIAETVGNVIQSDSLDLGLTVEAVQCRHNDDTPFTDDAS
jgi:predicted ribosomally synthesized peptide with SipW-like signal peptide